MPVTNYLWDMVNDNVLAETDENGEVTAEYTYEPDLFGNVISQERDGVESFYHFDGLGSTRVLTDESAEPTDTYTYSAFGDEVSNTGTTENAYRYVGEKGYYFDQTTDDYYVRARTYTPTTGRWSSLDPSDFPVSQLQYNYCNLNPSTRRDPSGLQPSTRPPSLDVIEQILERDRELFDVNPGNGSFDWHRVRRGDHSVPSCHPEEQACITNVIQIIRTRIGSTSSARAIRSSCFNADPNYDEMLPGLARMVRRDPETCRTCRSQLDNCIIDTLRNGISIGCASDDDRWGSCSTGPRGRKVTKRGYTKGWCQLAKARTGPRTTMFDLTGQEHYLTFDTTCNACPRELLSQGAQILILCRRHNAPLPRAPEMLRGPGCNAARQREIASTLIHELLHNCVGPKETTDAFSLRQGREGVIPLTNEWMRNCWDRSPIDARQ